MRLLLFLLTNYEVTGQENIPDAGPLLITPNHLSAVDLPAIMAAIPHQAIGFAASRYRTGFYGLILHRFDVIFVRRGTPDRQALRRALEVLENGAALGVAPEGTRSPTKALIRGKPGAAFLALRSGATVLPIGVTGTEKVLQEWLRFRRPKIRVVVGEPYRLEAPEDSRYDLQTLSDQMMLRIADLLPEEYRGVYANWNSTVAEDSHAVETDSPRAKRET